MQKENDIDNDERVGDGHTANKSSPTRANES